jgi:MSHA pilin protein MshA
MKKFNKQAGFTLIELIMVIVILGVLSAFALPRFADLGGNARTASINGLAGTIKAAANIAHAQALVDAGAHDDDVTLEGQAITMTQFYPTPDADGIGQAAQVSSSATGADADYI